MLETSVSISALNYKWRRRDRISQSINMLIQYSSVPKNKSDAGGCFFLPSMFLGRITEVLFRSR